MFRDYDNYFSALYGDYMKLPPEKDRKPHPVNKLKFPGKRRWVRRCVYSPLI